MQGRQSNRELLNMCQAVPSYPPAPELQEEFARLARLPNTGGYTEILGIPELRDTFAARLSADYQATVTSADIGITTGCNQAFAAAIMALAEAGDNVVMPAPFYFNHNMWLGMVGVQVKPISAFSAQGAWPSPGRAQGSSDTQLSGDPYPCECRTRGT